MKKIENKNSTIKERNEALTSIFKELSSTTSSVAQIPKPLKFLSPYYNNLKKLFENELNNENKIILANIISVCSMTMSDEKTREGIKFRLLGSKEKDLKNLGHEYIRFLSGQIAEEYNFRLEEEEQKKQFKLENFKNETVKDLNKFIDSLVPYFIENNSEPDACDLFFEIEQLERITEYTDKSNYLRICEYLKQSSSYVLVDEQTKILSIIYKIYRKMNRYCEALRTALLMNDKKLIKETFDSCKDKLIQKQMSFILGRVNLVSLDFNEDDSDSEEDSEEDESEEDDDDDDDEEEDDDDENSISKIMGNSKRREHYLYVAKKLELLEPKTPEDIFKTQITGTRSTISRNIDSARQNLAASFVNGFINCGFSTDKITSVGKTNESGSWIYKHKDVGMMSAAASMGLVHLWNEDKGMKEIDKYLYCGEDYITGGACLAIGLAFTGIKNEFDTCFAMLNGEYLQGKKRDSRLGAILGLGVGYAGSFHNGSKKALLEILENENEGIDILCFTVLALGFIFVGSANQELANEILMTLFNLSKNEENVNSPLMNLFILGFGLLFIGKPNEIEMHLKLIKNLPESISNSVEICLETCAYAGSGSVLQIQKLLKVVGRHIEEEQKEKLEKEKEKEKKENKNQNQNEDKKKEDDKKKENEKKLINKFQSFATIGISMIAMGEELGSQMIINQYEHILHYCDPVVKRAVPLSLGLLCASNPKLSISDTLNKLSHDSDEQVSQNAILALGLIGAGTNNARIGQFLIQLSQYYSKYPNHLFLVRIAQGLLYAGKGLISINPFYSDRQILNPVTLAGILSILYSSVDMKDLILDKFHYLLYTLGVSIHPRMLLTLDTDLKPINVSVRVGTAVDVVAKAGKPKTITGFQTHDTPVLLSFENRAELSSEKYIPITSTLEDIVILKKNPDYEEEE